MDKNQLIEIIRSNPNMSYGEMKKQATEAGVSSKIFEEAWNIVSPKKNFSKKSAILVGIIFIVFAGIFMLSKGIYYFLSILLLNPLGIAILILTSPPSQLSMAVRDILVILTSLVYYYALVALSNSFSAKHSMVFSVYMVIFIHLALVISFSVLFFAMLAGAQGS